MPRVPPVIVGSDDHAPFNHPDRLEFYAQVKRQNKGAEFVHAGDLIDFHAMSRHLTEVDAPNAEQEYEDALKFVKGLVKIFPKGNLVLGNHDLIPQRQMKTIGLTTQLLKNLHSLYGLPPGWNIHMRYYVIPQFDVLVEHGIKSGGMYGCFRTALKKRCSFVQGHIHAHAMVKYGTNYRDTIFGMNVGCGCDDSALAMRYSEYSTEKGVLACGIVEDRDYARVIPMRG